jgi:manganese efflux pump family protein
MLERLKSKWGINSNSQIVIIFIVFGVTGSSAAALSGPVMDYFNISKSFLHPLIYWPLRILVLFPVYQILLTWFGFFASALVSVFTCQKDKFYFNFFYKIAKVMVVKMIKLLSGGILFKN